MLYDIPDIQKEEPLIKIPIHQVGIQNLISNFKLETINGNFIDLIANISLSTNLENDVRGISMSNLILILSKYINKPLKHKLIKEMIEELQSGSICKSNSSFIKFDFKYPIMKKSPITGLEFPVFYDCSFEGRIESNIYRFFERVIIQYSSYCPCSSSLCEHLEKTSNNKGYPHAQRSFSDVLIEVSLPNIIWIEEIIESVEKSVINVPIPILKRIDEQYIAIESFKNKMFVEDAIRSISNNLNNEKRIKDWIIKCVHQESIHTHDAIAINWKGIENGFNGIKFT